MPINMTYCRFNNTVEALEEALTHIYDDLSKEEHDKRIALIDMIMQAAEELKEIDPDELPVDK